MANSNYIGNNNYKTEVIIVCYPNRIQCMALEYQQTSMPKNLAW